MSNQRLLAIGLIFVLSSVAYVLERITDILLRTLSLDNGELFGGISTSWAISFVVTLAIALALWFNESFQEAGQDVTAELRKVTWPGWPEIRAATGAVVVVAVITAILLGLMDFISAKIMSDWIPAGISWAQHLFA